MGHELIATNYNQTEELARLRISGTMRTTTKIYEILKAQKHNKRDSGDGGWQRYETNDLQAIFLDPNTQQSLNRFELAFLEQIIKNAKGRSVLITFA